MRKIITYYVNAFSVLRFADRVIHLPAVAEAENHHGQNPQQTQVSITKESERRSFC